MSGVTLASLSPQERANLRDAMSRQLGGALMMVEKYGLAPDGSRRLAPGEVERVLLDVCAELRQ